MSVKKDYFFNELEVAQILNAYFQGGISKVRCFKNGVVRYCYSNADTEYKAVRTETTQTSLKKYDYALKRDLVQA